MTAIYIAKLEGFAVVIHITVFWVVTSPWR